MLLKALDCSLLISVFNKKKWAGLLQKQQLFPVYP